MKNNKILPVMSGSFSQQQKQRQRAAKALSNARQRCTNPKNKDYANYGAQGIKVLLTLDELIDAIGLPHAKATLDRIDPTGHYELGNVRWASKAVQAANKKTSWAGGSLSLDVMILKQKKLLEQEQDRAKVASSWLTLLSVFNRGSLLPSEKEELSGNLCPSNALYATYGPKEVIVDDETQIEIHLPALSLPNSLIPIRAPMRPAPDPKIAKRCTQHGRLFRLHDEEFSGRIPETFRVALEQTALADCCGLTLVGRPTQHNMTTGWFEGWMLHAASRLPLYNINTAMFPILECLDRLTDIGGPAKWDYESDPVLDAKMLFIPDLQLDCGHWGELTTYQFGIINNLLKYRVGNGHKTVVGVQTPGKLSQPLQKTLLGVFDALSFEDMACLQLS